MSLPLREEELRFDPEELGPIGPWLAARRAFVPTATRAGTVGGARDGRVALEVYQVAPVLRIPSRPRPRLLTVDDVGLGGTIEAGLGSSSSCSGAAPTRFSSSCRRASIPQLEEETKERFGLEFEVIEKATVLARAQPRLPAGLSP